MNRVTRKNLSLAMSLLVLAACKPSLLPNTEVEDSEANRAVYDVMVRYREALEKRDADAILAMVSPDYFETGGTEDPADDYGFDELQTHLRDDLERTQIMRVNLHIKSIEIKDEQAVVTYRYTSRAQVRFPTGPQWVSKSDVNQMKLKQKGDTWIIIGGL